MTKFGGYFFTIDDHWSTEDIFTFVRKGQFRNAFEDVSHSDCYKFIHLIRLAAKDGADDVLSILFDVMGDPFNREDFGREIAQVLKTATENQHPDAAGVIRQRALQLKGCRRLHYHFVRRPCLVGMAIAGCFAGVVVSFVFIAKQV